MARVSFVALGFIIGLLRQFTTVAAGSGGEYVSSISSRNKVAMMRNAIESTRQAESQKMVEVDRKVQDISATSLNSKIGLSDNEVENNLWGVIAPIDSVKNVSNSPVKTFLTKIVEVSSSVERSSIKAF